MAWSSPCSYAERVGLLSQCLSFAHEVEDSPVHFATEVALVAFILYILLFKRSYDPQKKGYGGRKPTDLGDSMREELLADWEPEPLGECWAERGHGGRCGGPTLVTRSPDLYNP